MLYTVYKTHNLINGKEYIGFHSINNEHDILVTESENGSIFKDGYMGSGKLIKKALEKYKPHNMKQELLFITSDKSEAENIEKSLVNSEWIASDDNYNLSIGGNVCILFGEDNGFYGKKHSQETLDKIQNSRNKFFENNNATWCEVIVKDSDIILYTYQEVFDYFGIDDSNYTEKYFKLCSLVNDEAIIPKSIFLKNIIINNYNKRVKFLESGDERKKKAGQKCSDRFKGVPKTEESNIKRGESIKNWIENNPDKHTERMDKINKNPDKIRKTADKHRGMKRSEETRKNISDSLKGKPPTLKYGNEITRELQNFKKGSQPENWELAKKRRYINKITGQKKYFYYEYEDASEDWIDAYSRKR